MTFSQPRGDLGVRWLATALAAPRTVASENGLPGYPACSAGPKRWQATALHDCTERRYVCSRRVSRHLAHPTFTPRWPATSTTTDVPPHRGRPRPARPAGEGVFFMQELHRPRTFRTRDRLRRPCAKNKDVWPNVSRTRLLHRSDEPTGVGRGEGRPSVSQPRLPLQPDKPAGGGLTIFPAGVVFDRSGSPANCPYVRTVARA